MLHILPATPTRENTVARKGAWRCVPKTTQIQPSIMEHTILQANTMTQGNAPSNSDIVVVVEKQRLSSINLDGDCSSSSLSSESRKAKARAKGLARAYKRMDSKRALSSSKLTTPLSPIKETKPKLTTSLSNRSVHSITDFVDFDESSFHDSVLEDADVSEVSLDGDASQGSLHIDFGASDHGLTRTDSVRSMNSSTSNSIPAELLMEDPSLADTNKHGTAKQKLSRQDSSSSCTSMISSSGDSVDTFVLSQTPRC